MQILVPPARADIMLFRPPGTSDLGFPLDMTNGAALAANSNGIAGSMQPEEEAARAAGAAIASQASLPVLPGVDRLPMVAGPLSPQRLKCFSSDSDNCPDAGIGPLLQFPHLPRAGPVLLTLLFFPLVPLPYPILQGSTYSFPAVRYSCLVSVGDLQALLCLKVRS